MNANVSKLLNEQINKEFYSAYLYLDFANYYACLLYTSCEQTAGCAGCTGKAGVCGKTTEVAELQDQLTGALVGLSRAVDNAPDTNEGTWRLMIEGLFTTVTNVNFNEKTIRDLIGTILLYTEFIRYERMVFL